MKRTASAILAAILASVLMLSCTPSGRNADMTETAMFPDYADIAIPSNIAPLNFRIDNATAIKVTIEGNNGTYTFKSRGELMKFPLDRWKEMTGSEVGNTLKVTVSCTVNGESVPISGFTWQIAEPIDRYLSYRLIEPAYEVWNEILIEERDIENFRTRLLGNNSNAGKCCMNCHTSNRNGTSFMHMRGTGGGTVLNRNGQLSKLNTRTDSTVAGAVYGDISRDGRYGIFTAANITFAIHSARDMRMEVFDTESDLVLIDFDSLTLSDSRAVKGAGYQETFPCFSADGKTVFFCRAEHLSQPDSTRQMMYDIAAVDFNPENGLLGDSVRTLVSGRKYGVSFSHLKCSPDGRFLLVTAASYGTFPIWHPESQLWLIDLTNGHVNLMPSTNGEYADTYHSWSSNSRWIVFASKRDDKVYGRPYIAHIDENGYTTKAFLLPQKDPDTYRTTLKSFNIPELYTEPEQYNARSVARIYSNAPAERVRYRER